MRELLVADRVHRRPKDGRSGISRLSLNAAIAACLIGYGARI